MVGWGMWLRFGVLVGGGFDALRVGGFEEEGGGRFFGEGFEVVG